jgi:hypothetical protein
MGNAGRERVHKRVHGSFCAFVQAGEKLRKPLILLGGRTRTRTLDPLIKGQLLSPND